MLLLLLCVLIGTPRVIPREHMLAHMPGMLLGACTFLFALHGLDGIPQEPDHDHKIALVWAMLAPLLPLLGCCMSTSFEKWLDNHRGVEILVAWEVTIFLIGTWTGLL